MTKPRTSPDRELFGIIGKVPNARQIQKEWNRKFTEEGKDAFMDYYPTTKETIPERLSEMFHFDRRAYIVGEDLSEVIASFLDVCTESKVNLVLNREGVLFGVWIDNEESLFTEAQK